ncbi:MAG: 5-formyltetrahydrofolate cyclo-ligase [Planctomycetota bacterium]|jgi:5-formyltetrahydrofolate cyclo-ligase
MNSIQAQKAKLRTELKKRRQDIPEPLRREKNLAIQQKLLSLEAIRIAKSIFCFISHGSEVDTHSIIDQLLLLDKLVAVPKLIESNSMNAIQFLDWEELEAGQLGILSPRVNTRIIRKFDATITPGLGFTEDGKRLGFGQGYYDRWFQTNGAGMKIALAYETQLLEDLLTSEHDVKVDMIVTEKRLIMM